MKSLWNPGYMKVDRRGNGKKRTRDTFTSRLVCRSHFKVSVNICVILSDITEFKWFVNEVTKAAIEMYLFTFQASGEC